MDETAGRKPASLELREKTLERSGARLAPSHIKVILN